METPNADESRALAVALFNHTRALLDREDRTAADDDDMLHAAHASRHHWAHATGTGPANLARGEWLCSRVYAVLGRGEAALWHGRRYLQLCADHDIADWDLAFAYEAIARAHSVLGDADATREHLELAEKALTDVADDADRDVVTADLATIVIPT